MKTEDLLTELFAREAERRPEPNEVFEALHERIGRPRRVTGGRVASALAAAAGVAAIAVATSVLGTPSGPDRDPAGAPRPTTPTTTAPAVPPKSSAPVAPLKSGAPAAPRSSAPVTTASRPPSSAPTIAAPHGRNYSTINAGWLPGPAKQNPSGTSNQPGFEERDWDVTVDGVAMDVIIWTESGSLPSRMQATGGGSNYRRITINGHPGREFVSSNITIVAFDRGNGTIAYVGPSVQRTTATVTSARIASIAMRVARTMQFDRHDPI